MTNTELVQIMKDAKRYRSMRTAVCGAETDETLREVLDSLSQFEAPEEPTPDQFDEAIDHVVKVLEGTVYEAKL